MDMRGEKINHRDLHPSNIMINFGTKTKTIFSLSQVFDFSFITADTDFTTVIIDFGLAKVVQDFNTKSADIGTTNFRAPETKLK